MAMNDPWWRRRRPDRTSRRAPAAPSLTAAPGESGDANPLARLDAYEMKYLVTHLAAAERAGDLRHLLFLRTGSEANAWFAAAPDVRTYLSDLAQAQQLASRQGDCSAAVAYRLIGNSLRDMASVPASLLKALVRRGLLPMDGALAMAQSAETPGQRITASAALLSQLDRPRQLDLAERLMEEMTVRSQSLSSVGQTSDEFQLPLLPRDHIEVIRDLMAVPELPAALLERLVRVAATTISPYVRVKALAEVAGVLPQDQRAAALATAWDIAQSQDDFRGRPEGEALVAAACGRHGRAGRDYAAQALATTLRVLTAWPERINFHDWVPYADDPTFGRSPAMRLRSFAEPLALLGPCLTDDELGEVAGELRRQGDSQAQLATIAILPEIAARGHVAEAFQLASSNQGGTLWAQATLLGAGYAPPPGSVPPDILNAVTAIPDAEQQVLVMLALLPALGEALRYQLVRKIVAEVEDTASARSFRKDVIDLMPPLIRGLSRQLRNDLITLAAKPGKLTRTTAEADALLLPLAALWPDSLLVQRLSESRSVALDQGMATRLREQAEPARERPARAAPTGSLILPPSVATRALESAGGWADADKAAAVLFLLPFLDHLGRDAARDLVASIDAPHLKLLPTVELLAGPGEPSADSLVAAVELLAQAHGNLNRLQSSIDTLATLVRSPNGAPVAGPWCGLIQARGNADIAAVLPIAEAVSGTALRAGVADTISALEHWFGPVSPRREAEEDTTGEVPVLRLDTGPAAVELIRQLSLAHDWAGVTHLLAAVRAAPELEDATIEQAELCVLGGSASVAEAPDQMAEHRALVEQIIRDAPTKARRLTALAWLLADAAHRKDTEDVARLSRHPDLGPDPDPAGDPYVVVAVVAASQAASATGQVSQAAAALTALLSHVAADITISRLIAAAASSLQVALDSHRTEPEAAAVAEQALALFLEFVSRRPDNYVLQESAGTLIRNRVSMALAAGRVVREEWLARLEALADADDPEETLLEALPIGAQCDAARSAVGRGDGPAAVRHLRAAFTRWCRNRPVDATARDFVDASHTVLAGLSQMGEVQDAAEVARPAGVVCAEAGIEVPEALAERLRGLADPIADRASASPAPDRPAAATGPDRPFGSFGGKPEDIARTEFYSYFHLEETSRIPMASGEVNIRYQNKNRYRDLCALECATDAAGNISRLSLDIVARFIEQPATAPMARDFARSFIGGATATREDVDAVRAIIDDLRERPMPGMATISRFAPGGPEEAIESMKRQLDLGKAVVVNMGGNARQIDLPEIPSRGFAVYQGERKAFTITLSATTFTMLNDTAGDERTLKISFTTGRPRGRAGSEVTPEGTRASAGPGPASPRPHPNSSDRQAQPGRPRLGLNQPG